MIGILQSVAFCFWHSLAFNGIAPIRIVLRASGVCAGLPLHTQSLSPETCGRPLKTSVVLVFSLLLWSDGIMRESLMTLFSIFIFVLQRKERWAVLFFVLLNNLFV